MKAKKRYVKLCAALLAAMLLTACGGNETSGEVVSGADAPAETTTQTENIKSDGYEKFSQLKIGMTESEVNAILGEPTKVDKADYTYTVTVNGKEMDLTVWISTVDGKVCYLYGDFCGNDYRAEFADSKTDLSAVDKLENDELKTYDDCVAAFKTPGYLSCVDDDDVKVYFWVDANDGYLRVTFKADGTVKSYNGFC